MCSIEWWGRGHMCRPYRGVGAWKVFHQCIARRAYSGAHTHTRQGEPQGLARTADGSLTSVYIAAI